MTSVSPAAEDMPAASVLSMKDICKDTGLTHAQVLVLLDQLGVRPQVLGRAYVLTREMYEPVRERLVELGARFKERPRTRLRCSGVN